MSRRLRQEKDAIIYLMQFKGGLLKVGRTVEWAKRKRAHGDRHADGYVDHILIKIIDPSKLASAERAALEIARRTLPTAQKHEWFVGFAHDLVIEVVAALDAAGIEHEPPTGGILESISPHRPMLPGSMAQWVDAMGIGERSCARLLGIDLATLRRMNHEGAPSYMAMACWYVGWKAGRWAPRYIYPWDADFTPEVIAAAASNPSLMVLARPVGAA